MVGKVPPSPKVGGVPPSERMVPSAPPPSLTLLWKSPSLVPFAQLAATPSDDTTVSASSEVYFTRDWASTSKGTM